MFFFFVFKPDRTGKRKREDVYTNTHANHTGKCTHNLTVDTQVEKENTQNSHTEILADILTENKQKYR